MHMHIKVLLIAILSITTIAIVGFGENCYPRKPCPSPCPPPVEIEVEIEKPEPTLGLIKTGSCDERHIQFGIRSQIIKDFSFLEGSVNLRSGLWDAPITFSGGPSFGFVKEEGGLGANLSLALNISSVSIQTEGTWWMLTNLQFREIKVKALFHWNFNSKNNAWIYIGTKAISFYSRINKWSGGIGFILGGGAELCFEKASLGTEIEFQGIQWGHECLPKENVPGLEAGVYICF